MHRHWPRQDGSYAALDDGIWEYLRFFPGDLVASISSHLPPEEFAVHIVPGEPVFSYGFAVIHDDHLEVTTRNEEGAVTFRVHRAAVDALRVDTYSHVNGRRFASIIYRFFPS